MTRVAINGMGRIGRSFLRAWLDRSADFEVENLRQRLALSEVEWADLDAQVQEIVAASLAFAQARTDPRPDDAPLYVYAPTSAPNAPIGAERQR